MMSYKRRFLPWIYLNFNKHSCIRKPTANIECETANIIKDVYHQLDNFTSDSNLNNMFLFDSSGFNVSIKPSNFHNRGVFVSKGSVSENSVVAYYPGTIYSPGESLLLQSFSNKYIFQCADGKYIDGKHSSISRMIYKSCFHRNTLCEYQTCDLTWMSLADLLNPLACGQLVNNGGRNNANVNYYEIDIDLRQVRLPQRKFIPNVNYSEPTRYLRMIILLSMRDICEGEEILSSYFTVC